jgi:endonuclease YncB( thermonuclease family)
VHADEKLSAFVELERVSRESFSGQRDRYARARGRVSKSSESSSEGPVERPITKYI